MWFLVAAAGAGALLTGGLAIRGLSRWLVLRRLPIVGPAEFAAAEPGTAVILAGRTATLPDGQAHGLTIHVQRYRYTGEGFLTDETIGASYGDSRLHSDDGAAVDVDIPIRRANLCVGRPAMLTALPYPDREELQPGATEWFDRELVMPADRSAFAAGRVGAGRDRLETYDMLVGSAIGDVADLGRDFCVEITGFGAGALLLTGVFLVLIR